MESNISQTFVQFCIVNFNYNPETLKEENNSISQNKESHTQFKFPEDKISNLFFNECLSLLAKTNDNFKKNNANLIMNILIVIYNFVFKGNNNAFEFLFIYGFKLPFQMDDDDIQKSFDKKEDFKSFQLFNLVLMKYNDVNDDFYKNNNFFILESLLLYDYTFISKNKTNIKFKHVICNLIKTLINFYIKLSGENIIAMNLKNFFYKEGKIKNNLFLVPENVYNNGYAKFNNLIENIKQIIINESDIQLFVNNLYKLNDFKRLKIDIEEDSEETEFSSEGNNNNEESNKEKLLFELNKKIEKLMKSDEDKSKKIENLIKSDEDKSKKIENLTKSDEDKSKKIENLNLIIENLTQSQKYQNDKIDAQQLNIENLNNIILNREFTIEQKEKNIEELKKNKTEKNKDLKQNKTSINQYLIQIDNQKTNLLKQSQLITKLTNQVNDLQTTNEQRDKKINSLNDELKIISNKLDLIGCRDFLREIFKDFCDFFKVIHNGKYKDAAKLIIEKINQKDDDNLKIFVSKVNLIDFIKKLGDIIEDSDNLSHYFFKELSIKYKKENIGILSSTEENINKNIIKCNILFNEYSKNNFDYYFSFLINECNYSNYIINNINMNDNVWFNAIKKYNGKK